MREWRSATVVKWTILGLPLVVACAHQGATDRTADRAVEKLRADLAKIEADRDRLEQRVGALEAVELRRREADETRGGPRTPAETARRLPVVRVGEDGAEGAPVGTTHGEAPDIDTGHGESRTVLRAAGSRGSADRRVSKEATGDVPALSPDAKHDYEAALGLARAKQHDKALQALTAFLVRYPDHPYVENAMYWRGECFYAKGEFSRAATQFEGVIARFPYGNKAPDALLKLGLSQEKAGGKELAQKSFAELQDRYPKSDAARQIPHL